MIDLTFSDETRRAEELARLALESAREACVAAGFCPFRDGTKLIELVVAEVKVAVEEMGRDRREGGPLAVAMLANPACQNIYFADAGRRAAEALAASSGPAALIPNSGPRPEAAGGTRESHLPLN